MFDISKSLFQIGNKNANGSEAILTKDAVAELLGTTPEALAAFEASYQANVLDAEVDTGSLFDLSAKQAAAMLPREDLIETARKLNDRIIVELLEQTPVMTYDGTSLTIGKVPIPTSEEASLTVPVTLTEVQRVPESIRPQLTGSLMKKDIGEGSSSVLLATYKNWLEAKDPEKKQMSYHMFRRGLDILDLDPITYEMLSMNPNSMGYWLPPLIDGIQKQRFFKVPKTKVIKVPLTLLQLSRMEYSDLTPGTMDILDRFCYRAFELDETKSYFIKTGTYSSKFDFRNAKVTGAKEVRELGEYLLFIQNQAVIMAGYLTTPSIYGVSTTNEWVVREFIENVDNCPCIYKGLPLHAEYRVFVDFDEDTVLGMNPYWDPNVMKQRFGHKEDADSPHQVHDYITYKMYEDTLMRLYRDNSRWVKTYVEEMVPHINLPGQWSIDIMQNGDDFWVIDMATAETSALSDCVPKGLLKHAPENWLPKLPAPGVAWV